MSTSVSDTLGKLRSQFADQLPEKLDAISAHYQLLDLGAWMPVEAEVLHRLLHALTGSAGTFGMPSISDAARTLENRLSAILKTKSAPTTAEWLDFGAALKRFDQLARIRLESNSPSLKPPSSLPRLNHAPLIYLVEDDLEQAAHLSQALQDDGYRVQVFTTTNEFRLASTTTGAERPDAMVMDMIFPDGDDAGVVLLTELKAKHGRCPPVVFASVRDDLSARLAAFRAGASRYLVKPVNIDLLRGLLDELTGRQPQQPYRVLMVDDDVLLLEAQAEILRAAGMEVHTLSQPLLMMEMLKVFTPDVAVLDVYMPDASGPELAAILRESDEQLHLPILFLSAETDMSQQLLALNLGGDDFLVKPVQPAHLIAAVTARARRARQNSAIQKRLEITLYEREREHLALNQHAIVSIADRAGNITYINDKFCEISGYSRDELMGHNHRLLKSAEHPPEFYADLWRTIAGGKVWQGEVCNRRKDGSLYWVASTITPFMDADGKPYQYVSIRTDISKPKHNELRLHLQSRAMESSVNGISIADARATDMPLIYVNPAFERITGYSSAEVLGKNCRFLQGDDRAQPDLQKIHDVFREQRAGTALLRNFHKSGELFWNELTVAPVLDAEGEVTHYIGVSNDISPRKLAEQEAEASKERLRRGQFYANIGTWDWNIQSGELFWTERIAPLFGHSTGDLETTYDNFLAAIHVDDRQAVIDAVAACVDHDTPYDIEHRVVWPDGTVRWLQERGGVKRDPSGKPMQMLGVVQDIDDRKRAELALAERELQLREAQALARIGNWTANIVTGELSWSDEIYRIFGHQPGSFAPSIEAFRTAIHPDDHELVEESEMRAQITGIHDVIHRIVRPDGTVRHVHELAQAENDASGKLIRMSGTVQDITERMQAKALLRETEDRFTFAVEGAGDGVWDWDMRSNAMKFSRLYMAMLGYVENELPNHADTWTSSVHPDDLERITQNLQDYLAGKSQAYHVELRLRCKDGDYKWILCRGKLVERDKGGNPVRMIGIHSDITEGKHNEQLLIVAREEADRANRTKSEFLSSMSHELRTPMNGILGFGQLLVYDDTLQEEHKDSVKEILKAGYHLLELINEVLDLSKVESGSIDLSIEPVEVCPIVDECLGLVRSLADKRGIKISHNGLLGAVIRADRTRFRQILLNLLSNAIKYNREGGSVKLEVKVVSAEGLRINVTDTGLGIPAARLAEVFQPFNRLGAENSTIEGTGIGLTITRRIVELMGGSVDVESTVGVGSTFWIELPLDSMLTRSHSAKEGSKVIADTTTQRTQEARHTVLYIEDNPSNLRLVAQILGIRKNIDLLTAHTPELGIELALARQPDLILLDINMPGMDGYQVLAVLKATASLKAIPVVAVTANAMPRDIERGREAGFADYLTKPIDVVKFIAALNRFLTS